MGETPCYLAAARLKYGGLVEKLSLKPLVYKGRLVSWLSLCGLKPQEH